MTEPQQCPDFPGVGLVTECSWEVCNKIGGIYTVLSTKAVELKKMFGDRLVFIGPWLDPSQTGDSTGFKVRKTILKNFASKALPYGIKVKCGRWDIPGSPIVMLVDFRNIFPHLNEFYGKMWENFSVDSLHAYGDYDESCAFAIASSIAAVELGRHLKVAPKTQLAHYNEWTTGMGLLHTKLAEPSIATVFTTHATTIGRSICGNGKALYEYFDKYNGDQMASELNVASKHSLEKMAAWNADCFTTVSDVTARECEQLLGRRPDVVTPNGFEPSFVPSSERMSRLRREGRKRILKIASVLGSAELPRNTFVVATSGRNEFRNKGLDLFLDSVKRMAEKAGEGGRKILALVLVPAWVSHPSSDLLVDLDFGGGLKPEPDYLTHRLNNEDSDAIACTVRRIDYELCQASLSERLKIVFVPSYLDGNDGIVNISYYDFLPAVDLTVFGSYYEPWGYTPLESVAFGVPTLTTDKAGFGEWVKTENLNSLEKHGVAVIERCDSNYSDCVEKIADISLNYMRSSRTKVSRASKGATETAAKAEWKFFILSYREAFEVALKNAVKRG